MTTDRKQQRASGLQAGLAISQAIPAPPTPLKSRSDERFGHAEQIEIDSQTTDPAKRTVQKVQPIRAKSSGSVNPTSTEYAPYAHGNPVVPGMRLSVALEIVDENPMNPRAFITSKDIHEFAENLRSSGQLVAGTAYFQNDRFRLKSGHRRRRALQLIGASEIHLDIVHPPNDQLTEFKEERIANTQRRQHTLFDDAVRFGELLKSSQIPNQRALITAFDVTESYVSKVLSIGEMPISLLERMVEHSHVFGLVTGYNVSQVSKARGEVFARRLIERIIDGKLSSRQVDQVARAELGKAPNEIGKIGSRSKTLSRATLTEGATGELKVFETGQVKLDIRGLPSNKCDLLFARVVRVFDELGLKYQAPTIQSNVGSSEN